MGNRLARCACLLLALLLLTSSPIAALAQTGSLSPGSSPAAASASAEEGSATGAESRVVRVAFPLAEGLSMVDEAGNRSGIFYDWLTEIAKYTGWRYEFVDGTVEELMDAVATGKVDIIGNMYYREQLDDLFDYSQFSTGANRALLICPIDDDSIKAFDLRTLNGKRIGVFQNATDKIRRLNNYLEFNGLQCTVVPLGIDAYQSSIDNGTVDVLVSSDAGMREDCKVVAEFESEPHFIAMPNGSDLAGQLDEAMARIYDADPNFAHALYNSYFPKQYPNAVELDERDRSYVAQAPLIKVAVVAGQYPLYYEREKTAQGVVKDVFDRISERTGLSFEFVHAQTYEQAIGLLESGEADVLGAFMDNERMAQNRGLSLTRHYASLDEVTFRNKLSPAPESEPVVAQIYGREADSALSAGSVVYFNTYAECMDAVNSGRADITVMPSSFAEGLFVERSYPNVTPTTADRRDMEFSIALSNPVDASLYSVLSKAVNSFTEEEMSTVLSHNTVPLTQRPMTFEMLMAENPLLVLGLFVVFFLLLGIVAATVGISKMRNHVMRLRLEIAEEMGRAKSDFLSRMSHEIRTPMNAIIGLTTVASLSGEATPAIRASLDKINGSAQFLLSLVNDILDMSKIENGKMQISVGPLSLTSLADKLENMFGIQAEESGVSLSVSCDVDDVLIGDDVRLQQVLANLLSNAFKFTEAGGSVRLSLARICSESDRVAVRFEVADDGVGIHEEDLERIFASFEQAAENRRNAQGTGLGLAISSSLVHLMGGKLEVRSQVGEGSTFFFTLEFPKGSEADAAFLSSCAEDAAKGERGSTCSLAGAHILIAEDNDLNAEIAIALLELEGATADHAANGREAVDMFAASEVGFYDFVLMDVQMPVLDGLSAAAEIRALDRPDAGEVPIIALTANTFQEDRDNAAAAGMNAFVPKPFDAQQLYKTICSFKPEGT